MQGGLWLSYFNTRLPACVLFPVLQQNDSSVRQMTGDSKISSPQMIGKLAILHMDQLSHRVLGPKVTLGGHFFKNIFY